MHNITLLSSFHKELGKCNSNELYRIIEEIHPEVIFEELPKDIFNIVYTKGNKPESLEAITIKKYLGKYPIKHIPVDTYEINDADIFNGYEIISKKSIEYIEVFNHQLSMTLQYGYSFLNSNALVELMDRMHIIEENVLSEINDANLLRKYKSYTELHDKRESKMLQSIYNFSKQYKYNTAIFICGAEHRKPIIQKIDEYEKTSEVRLNWNFNIPA